MKKTILLASVAFVLLFFSIAANNDFELLGDTQDYLAMSQSFLEGAPFKDPSRPFFLPLIHHPPLYSAFLAAFFFLFGFSYLGAKIVSIFLGVLSIIAFYFLLKKLDIKHKEFALLIYSTSIVFLYQANRILSDTLFILFLILALYFIFEYEKKQKIIDISGVLLAILLSLTFYARIAAIPLIIAIALYFILQKQWRKAAFVSIIFGLIVLPWVLFFANYQFQPYTLEAPESYINWATNTWNITGNSIPEISLRFLYNVFYFVFEGVPKTVFPLLLPLFFYLRNTLIFPILYLLGGVVFFFFGKTLWKRKKSIFGLYIIIYILIFAIQPALDDLTFVDRYMFGLFPLFIIFLMETLEQDFFTKRNIARPVLLIILLTGAFFSIGYAITLKDRMQNENYLSMKEAFAFVKKNIDKSESIVFHAPIHLYLNTGNKGTTEPSIADNIGANYVIIDGWTAFTEQEFKNFEVIFESKNKTSKILKRKNNTK